MGLVKKVRSQVKIVTGEYAEELQNRVNDFIDSSPYLEILDVQYRVVPSYGYDGSFRGVDYSAMVYYRL